ncbi:MAG: preprotein translocase subunit SecE [Verrucomicrobia bacterium]|nr:preprotein translocase subunit SecE [Verrucomicrobiota bacterium]MBI3868946.1 preprotein translocase subunit SecE [Verrucomicrobiota bacterium]
MNDYIKFGVGLGLLAVVFIVLWRMGHVARLSRYVSDTKEELRKCTWPSTDELKGHTAVVMVSIIMMAVFIVGIDFIVTAVFTVLNNLNKTA